MGNIDVYISIINAGMKIMNRMYLKEYARKLRDDPACSEVKKI